MRKKKFFFHYNKPKSQQTGQNILSVHFDGSCHFVHDVIVNVPIKTKHNKHQPRCVMTGEYSIIKIIENTAIVN